jgi:hypothetical protein
VLFLMLDSSLFMSDSSCLTIHWLFAVGKL